MFAGERHILSNFYPVRIHAWGHVFPNVESAYQFKKAIFNGDKSTAEKIKATRTERQAKESVKTLNKHDRVPIGMHRDVILWRR